MAGRSSLTLRSIQKHTGYSCYSIFSLKRQICYKFRKHEEQFVTFLSNSACCEQFLPQVFSEVALQSKGFFLKPLPQKNETIKTKLLHSITTIRIAFSTVTYQNSLIFFQYHIGKTRPSFLCLKGFSGGNSSMFE